MEQIQIRRDAAETTEYLIPIIQKAYEQSPTGNLKGYLVMDEELGVVTRKQLKAISSIDENGNALSCHGSVKCTETNPQLHTLNAILVGYVVKDCLIDHFKNQTFKKFEIILECLPEYRYSEKRRIKYRRTGENLLYMRVNIKW
jgi:hypothetical protein